MIGPVLLGSLGMVLHRVEVDTDAFGTFTGDVPRVGTMRDAALRKVEAAFAADPAADFAVASEGSFGPHPHAPMVASDLELVMLASRQGAVLEGLVRSFDTNYGHQVAHDVGEVERFAAHVHFPSHAVCLLGCVSDARRPDRAMVKGVTEAGQLRDVAGALLARHGAVWVETDMRAHLNPSRQQVIAQATERLVETARSTCPACTRAGFQVVDVARGLPCRVCGTASRYVRTEVWGCPCGHREERLPRHGETSVGPESSTWCNP